MDLLIVESPAKAKTLEKFLGKSFHVISSYGHIRALPSETGSVEPDNDFKMHFEILAKSGKQVENIIKNVKQSETIYLATDPDREGEAISWHIGEVIKQKKALPKNAKIKRVVFNEITKKAVTEAVANPRDIDMNMVYAQQARQALDYLVGFTLSPVLWRKLPGSKSAGRVQSVALRLISEREEEIEKFKTQEYWTLEAIFLTDKQESIKATLTHYDTRKLEKFDVPNEQAAKNISSVLSTLNYHIDSIEKKRISRNPSPPFITSTLIQEASRKLGFSARKTAQVAQKLYEGIDIGGETLGLITYMRTDSTNLANEALENIRSQIKSDFGNEYLPKSPRLYKTKAKNAQEAHEAIRPTNIDLKPQEIKKYLEEDQFDLYELIWKRTIACQMASAELDITSLDIVDKSKKHTFRASGSIVVFDGFYKVYKEDKDDEDEEQRYALPPINENDPLKLTELNEDQHFTQPPPRFTEASLVKKLEELGIGRPSTYPTIISILQERKYVKLEKKRFTPEVRGRIVSAFLINFFKRYVEYDFTANLEDSLDDIAGGEMEWKSLLKKFWKDFKENIDEVSKQKVTDIIPKIEEHLHYFLFHNLENIENQKCPKCKVGTLGLRLGSFGAFIGCSSYPNCDFLHNVGGNQDQSSSQENANGEHSGSSTEESGEKFPKLICKHPDSNEDIWLKKGPYGPYVQLGDDSKKKRVSIPRIYPTNEIDQKIALFLLSLPYKLGVDPETKEDIKLGIGKFGPYVQRNKTFASVKTSDLMSITLQDALSLIQQKLAAPPKAKFKPKASTKSKKK